MYIESNWTLPEWVNQKWAYVLGKKRKKKLFSDHISTWVEYQRMVFEVLILSGTKIININDQLIAYFAFLFDFGGSGLLLPG